MCSTPTQFWEHDDQQLNQSSNLGLLTIWWFGVSWLCYVVLIPLIFKICQMIGASKIAVVSLPNYVLELWETHCKGQWRDKIRSAI